MAGLSAGLLWFSQESTAAVGDSELAICFEIKLWNEDTYMRYDLNWSSC
jgi:hypothetical protein